SSVAACRVWKTPSGAPTARKASSIAAAQPGTWGSCFITAVLPAISAGEAKRKASQNGAFHGSTPSTVPSGRDGTEGGLASEGRCSAGRDAGARWAEGRADQA